MKSSEPSVFGFNGVSICRRAFLQKHTAVNKTTFDDLPLTVYQQKVGNCWNFISLKKKIVCYFVNDIKGSPIQEWYSLAEKSVSKCMSIFWVPILWVKLFSRLAQISSIEFKVGPNGPLGSTNVPSCQLTVGSQMVPKVVIILWFHAMFFCPFCVVLGSVLRVFCFSWCFSTLLSSLNKFPTRLSSEHHQRIISTS